METLPPFVDIHCHLLPGIDDGPATREEALSMARIAVAEGIRTAIATPHQLGSYRENLGTAIREQTRCFQQALDEAGIDLQVLPGADVRVEPDLVARLQRGEVLSLADRGRHVLLELPHDVYLPLDDLVAELLAVDVVPILSHPERNLGLLADPRPMVRLVEAGALLQVTGGSLLGGFGSPARRLAEQLLEQGLVHLIATDAHGAHARRPLMRRVFARTAEMVGKEAACNLCCWWPARVAAGEEVPAGRQFRRRRGWKEILAWSKSA